MQGRQVTIAELVKVLSKILQRPILDRTGYLEKFDVNIAFAYEEEVPVGIRRAPSRASAQWTEIEDGPSY